jgi:DNA-binding MarR family transcriptional regulator
MELLVLIVLSAKPSRDPTKLAKGLGLSSRRFENAWSRLRDKGLIAPSEETTSDPQPICEATEAGRNLAGYALIALELDDFEPELLQSLRAAELKAPFPRTDRPGGL